MKTLRKTYSAETKALEGEERTLVVKISTSNPDRSQDVVMPKGANLKNYLSNPVVALNHDYRGLSIAKTDSIEIKDDSIMAKVKFPKEGVYPLADTVYELYKDGFMNAWSIGFIPTDFEDKEEGGKLYKEWELLEYSAVLVPDNPEALTIMRSKGIDPEHIDESIIKGVIPYREHPTADREVDWNGPSEVASADVDDLKVMCTWFDDENEDIKQAYKLPHHRQDDKWTVWRGVTAAMAALLGARGGVNIPEQDRAGVYAHLAKHYEDYQEEAPEFRSYSEDEIKLIEKGEKIVKEEPKEEVKEEEKEVKEEKKEELEEKLIIVGKQRKMIENISSQLKELSTSLDGLLKETEVKEVEEVKDRMVIDLVEGLKVADKTIGLALRNYKDKVTGQMR